MGNGCAMSLPVGAMSAYGKSDFTPSRSPEQFFKNGKSGAWPGAYMPIVANPCSRSNSPKARWSAVDGPKPPAFSEHMWEAELEPAETRDLRSSALAEQNYPPGSIADSNDG